MKKLTTILLVLVCAVGTGFAGNGWTPNETYCKWGDNFKFDHAFVFYNDGAYNNTYGDGNVTFQEAQGVIAFSYRAWNEFSLPTGDNYLAEKVEVYLTADNRDEIRLVTLRMKDKSNYKKWQKTFNNECHYDDHIEEYNGCTAYFVQKRQVNDGDDQYAYFNIVCGNDVYNYIQNNKNNGLGMKLIVGWDGSEYTNSYRFKSGELADIMSPVSDPSPAISSGRRTAKARQSFSIRWKMCIKAYTMSVRLAERLPEGKRRSLQRVLCFIVSERM